MQKRKCPQKPLSPNGFVYQCTPDFQHKKEPYLVFTWHEVKAVRYLLSGDELPLGNTLDKSAGFAWCVRR